MKEIVLTNGKIALIDDEDYEKVSKYKWHYHQKGAGYAFSWIDGRQRFMHSFIMDCKKGVSLDHINHETLDNRRQNLRDATHSQNNAHKKKYIYPWTTSKYKGVKRNKNLTYNKWQAQIVKDRKHYYLGVFETEEEAALAYNNAAIKLFGEYAWLNCLKEER